MRKLVLSTIGVLLLGLSAQGITIEDLVGVYVGKRTTIYPTWTERNTEITVIGADGLVTNYVSVDWLPDGYAIVQQGYLELNDDGSFGSGEYGAGLLRLNGRHLDVEVHFMANPGFPSTPEATVHFRGHRTEHPVDFPIPFPWP